MAVNRFTKYTPREFVQTYDPYPMEKMMALAQHQQRRFDQIDTAIGKAYADAVIKPGLSVEGRRTAAKVNKERKEQLDSLVNNFYETRDVRGAVRGLSELSSSWKNDTRADFVNADRELMKPILNQTGQEGYGDYYTHKSYNPATGEHTLGYTDEQIAAGVAPTLADYGAMSNPGSTAAFKSSYIDPVKARIEQGIAINEKGERVTTTDKELTIDRFLEQVAPDLNNLSSDGVKLDNLSDAPPDLQKFIKWKKNEYRRNGQEYTLGSLTADYITEVKKFTFDTTSDKIKDLSKSEKDRISAEQSGGMTDRLFQGGDLNDKIVNKIYHEEGIEGIASELGFKENSDAMLELVIANTASKESKESRHNALVEASIKRQKSKLQRHTDPRTGEVKKVNEDLIRANAEEEALKYEKVLDKVYQLKIKALDNLANDPDNSMFRNAKLDEEGNIVLDPQDQQVLDNELEKAEDRAIANFLTSNFEGVFNKNDHPAIYEAIQQLPNTSVSVGNYTAETGIPDDFKFDPAHRKRIIQEITNLNKEKRDPNLKDFGNKIIRTFNPAYFYAKQGEVTTSIDRFNRELKKQEGIVREKYDPNEIIKSELDKVTKDYYGTRVYSTNEMLLYDKDATGADKFTIENDQMLAVSAKELSTDPAKLFKNGEKIPFDELEDIDFRESLGVDRSEPITLKDVTFNPKKIEIDYVATDKGYKVFAKGHFEFTEGQSKGEGTGNIVKYTDKPYQVDITDIFMKDYLTNSEKARLHYADMIADKAFATVKGSPQGESIYINDTQSEAAREALGGDTEIVQNADGTYNLSGKIPHFDDNGNLNIIDTENPTTDEEMDFVKSLTNMPLSQLSKASTDIASTVGWLTKQSSTPLSATQQAAVNNNPAITSVNDIETFKNGIFQLDSSDNNNAEQQVRIGFASTMNEVIPVEHMNESEQIRYASKLFTNGGGGWNQWDVTKKAADGSFENEKFKNTISVLKGIDQTKRNNPEYITSVLLKADKSSMVSPQIVSQIMNQFNKDMLRVNNSSYRASSLSRTEGLSDALVALAVVASDSNFDNSDVEAIAK